MKKAKLLLLVFMAPFLLISPFSLWAQTWLGTINSDWSTAGNWSTGIVPTNAQVATFNSTAVNCVITGNISVGGINITNGYTGIISIAAGGSFTVGTQNYQQAGATFNCGNGAFVCVNTSVFNQTGGTFTSSSNTITLGGSVNFFSQGFNANGGTILLNSSTGVNITVDGNNTATVTLNNVIINMPTPNMPTSPYLLGSHSTLIIQGDLTITRGRLNGSLPGHVRLFGNFSMAQTGTVGNLASNVDLEFMGSANTTMTLAAGGQTLYKGAITLNKTNPNNTVTLNSPLIMNNPTNSGFTFIMGKMVTTQVNILRVETNFVDVLGADVTSFAASDNSFIDGPMVKVAGAGNSGFVFPIGDNGKYAPLAISGANNSIANFGMASQHSFRAEYFRSDPNQTYNVNSREGTLSNIGRCEYWVLERLANPGANANPFVWLSYNSVRSCGISQPAELRIAKWNGAQWTNLGNALVTNNGVTFLSTSSIVSTFSPFNLASINSISNPLPVTLVDFSGHFRDDMVHLKWKTASENNNDHFEIERSADGKQFNSIGSVNGNGTTSDPHNYTFRDDHPLDGKNYYRIKQVDIDGRLSYSSVIWVNNAGVSSFSASITPNPAGSVMNLVIEGVTEKENLVFEVMNTSGMIVYRENISAAGTMMVKSLPRPAISAGLYFYKITRSSTNETFSGKLVLQ